MTDIEVSFKMDDAVLLQVREYLVTVISSSLRDLPYPPSTEEKAAIRELIEYINEARGRHNGRSTVPVDAYCSGSDSGAENHA